MQGMWTENRVERLKSMWADGLSCSAIAAKLGDVSRNGVIGKVHRLGLAGRAHKDGNGLNPFTGEPKKRTRKPRTEAQRARRLMLDRERAGLQNLTSEPETEAAVPFMDIPPAAAPCSLLDLGMDQCRYPIGDPQKPDFHFCGGQTIEGLPYCGGHARICYQPAVRRERKSVPRKSVFQMRVGRAG